MAGTKKKILNARQLAFIDEYAKHGNGAEAARVAGYSKRAAREQASYLLTNPHIKAEIQAKLKRVTEKADLKAADVLSEIRKIAFLDITHAFDEKGELLPLKEMPEDIRKALTSVSVTDLFGGRGAMKRKIGKTSSIRIVDKLKSLEMLAKHFKLLGASDENPNQPQGGVNVIVNLGKNDSEKPTDEI